MTFHRSFFIPKITNILRGKKSIFYHKISMKSSNINDFTFLNFVTFFIIFFKKSISLSLLREKKLFF